MNKEGKIIRYTYGEGTSLNMMYHLGKIVEYHPKGVRI